MESGAENRPDPTTRQTKKIIQPLTPSAQASSDDTAGHINRPKINPSEIYPEAVNEVPSINSQATPSQSFALASSQAQAEESNKLVCMRVKSVLVIGILLALGSFYTIFSASGQGGTIIVIAGFIQLLLTFVILVSKDQHTVALILKILLVLQLVGLFMSLVNPVGLVINGIMAILLGYAHMRVKTLSY